MRMLSETKLAINNIYARINVRMNPITSPELFPEKLVAIQERILDLAQIAAKTEQFMKEDRERARTKYKEPNNHGNTNANSFVIKVMDGENSVSMKPRINSPSTNANAGRFNYKKPSVGVSFGG
jgi:hypothetical protein